MRLAPLLAIALLASCAATRAAQADLEADLTEMRHAMADLQRAQTIGADPETIEGLQQRVDELAAEVKAGAVEVKEAAQEDTEGLLGMAEGGMQGGLIGLGAAALSWYLRDRRKRAGKDPLQRADIKAPPPTNG